MDYYDNNNSNEPFYGYSSNNESIYAREENSILSKVFWWMTAGLGLSAIAALGGYQFAWQYIEKLMIPLIILELVLVLGFSFLINKMSATTAKICFVAYSIVNGLTLTSIFFYYDIFSIYITFFITASMFAVAAIYGKLTKKNLARAGTYFIMGLWGIIIAGVVNIFLQNSLLDLVISVIGVVIFVGLTAYDVNKIKQLAIANEGLEDKNSMNKLVIWGALSLYLDFINLFLKLLRFFGRRKN